MYQARAIKYGAVILLHSFLFTIDDLGIARLYILFFFCISDYRHLCAEYRSVTIDRSKNACWPRNFWSHASTMYCLSATMSVKVVEYYLCMKPREYLFSHWVFNEIPVIIPCWWYPPWGYNARTFALWKEEGTLWPLPVSELLVKSDGIYQSTLWLCNSGPSCCLYP